MRRCLVFALPAALFALMAASACDGGEEARTGSPSPTATAASPSGTPVSGARPDPAMLLEPGYVLDRALEASLDGSDAGQIVVISHTTEAVLRTEDPSAAGVPAKGQCTSDTPQEGGSFDCLFQAEVFALDASEWTSVFVTPDYASRLAASEKSICGHRCGSQELGEDATFALGDGREVVILAIGYCTGIGSGCGTYYEVLTMRDGQVTVAYMAWQASFAVGTESATFDTPAFFKNDALCCPSGRRIDTLALDPATTELAVIESELVLCTEGTLVLEPVGAGTIAVACGPDAPISGSIYGTTPGTIVEPAAVGGLQGLREGDYVRIRYSTECEGATYNCALIAATISVSPP